MKLDQGSSQKKLKRVVVLRSKNIYKFSTFFRPLMRICLGVVHHSLMLWLDPCFPKYIFNDVRLYLSIAVFLCCYRVSIEESCIIWLLSN